MDTSTQQPAQSPMISTSLIAWMAARGIQETKELAHLAGLPPGAVAGFARGSYNPQPESREKLAQALGITVSELEKGPQVIQPRQSPNPALIGDTIAAWMRVKGFAEPKDLAVEAGLPIPVMARIVRNEISPSMESRKKIADTLGVSVDDLTIKPSDVPGQTAEANQQNGRSLDIGEGLAGALLQSSDGETVDSAVVIDEYPDTFNEKLEKLEELLQVAGKTMIECLQLASSLRGTQAQLSESEDELLSVLRGMTDDNDRELVMEQAVKLSQSLENRRIT